MAKASDPGQHVRGRPVAAQPELEEPVAAGRARLDQAPHRRAVAEQGAELGVAGVGVGVEVDHRHPAGVVPAGHPGDVGQGDGVVATQHHRDRPGGGDRVHGRLQPPQGGLDLAGQHEHVAGVHHPQLPQRVDPEGQGGPGGVVAQVVGAADGRGAEAGPRPVAGAAVEGGADHDHVGALQGSRVVQVGPRHAQEGQLRPVHGEPAGLRLTP
jgi:hypothetical protein